MSQFIFPPLTASLDSEQVNGGSLPAKQMIIGGYDGANVRAIKVDAAGDLQVDVVSSMPLPTGAATSALQIDGNALLTTISTKDFATQTTLATLATQTTLASLEGKDFATSAKQDTMITDLTNIETYTNTIQGAVSSGQMQVDIVADGAGLATEATLTTIDTDTGNIATSTASIATNTTGLNSCVDAGGSHLNVDVVTALPSGTNNIGDVDVLTMPAVTVNSIAPVDFLDSGVIDTSTFNSPNGIPTGTQVTVVSSLAAACTEIEVVDDIGEYMTLRVGGAVKAYLPLGGGRVKVSLSSTDTVQLESETGSDITNGKIAINFLG